MSNMKRSRRPIHTVPVSPSQDLARTAAAYQATVLGLVRQSVAGDRHADTVHAIRTHCRKLQALLELSGDARRAAAMARAVRRLSKLRALQVFRQYLLKVDASESDVATVEARIVKREQNLSHTRAYDKIEQVVWKQALPAIPSLGHSLTGRLDHLRHEHERRLNRLINAASKDPRRKRLHALRLALKTIRYQIEWLPGLAGPKQVLLKKIKRVQALLGRYEELADFKCWGERLNPTVQAHIRKDWKRARKRARVVPCTLSWLVDAMASGHLWVGVGQPGRLLTREAVRTI